MIENQKTLAHVFSDIPEDARTVLEQFDTVVQSVRPMNSKQLAALPDDIRRLSHLLTDTRGLRRNGYLNDTAALSAYMRYFLWWNLIRLTHFFSGTGSLLPVLADGSSCIDAGSGPLTVPIALWLARPELRSKRITWYCIDCSQAALAAGEDLFMTVAARTIGVAGTSAGGNTELPATEPWKIVRIKAEMGASVRSQADLVICANVFNEIVQQSGQPPEYTAKRAASLLTGYTGGKGSVLVIEPGTPPSVRFLSAFRSALFRRKYMIAAPCPPGMQFAAGGSEPLCPMDGRRGGKWCHFVLSTETAPSRLVKLSADAGLPKDRASLSFVLACPENRMDNRWSDPIQTATCAATRLNNKQIPGTRLLFRTVSEPIRLPGNRMGVYACSRLGLTLATVSLGGSSNGQVSEGILSGKADMNRNLSPLPEPGGSEKTTASHDQRGVQTTASSRYGDKFIVGAKDSVLHSLQRHLPVSGECREVMVRSSFQTDKKTGAVIVPVS